MAKFTSSNNSYDSRWVNNPICPGRFGFEVVPDDTPDPDNEDGFFSGKMLQSVLAIFLLIVFAYAGKEVYHKFEGISWTVFEKKIEEVAPDPVGTMPEIDEALLTAPEEPSRVENSSPTKRLFNPDGTMRAPFPMPPDSPPEDYYTPGQEGPTVQAPIKKATVPSKFDPEGEAYDPSEAVAAKRNADNDSSAAQYKPKKAKTIGAYEVFDPEAAATTKSDWEFFEDPRQ